MKDFIKNVFASLTAMILFFGLIAAFFFALVAMIIGAAISGAGGDTSTAVEKDSILVIDLTANITDQPTLADPAAVLEQAILGGQLPTYYLLEMKRAIYRAKNDPNINGILLQGTLIAQNYGSGLPVIDDLRNSLIDFKSSGKPVHAYIDQAMPKDLFLTSVADTLYINPEGIIIFNGIGGQRPFFSGTLDKYGIGVQVLKAGKYKSFVDMFTRTDLSEDDKEQSQLLLDNIWNHYLSTIAESLGTGSEALKQIANTQGMIPAEQAVQSGIVDQLATRNEVANALIKIASPSSDGSTFRQVSLFNYIQQYEMSRAMRKSGSGDALAIVYVEGDIIPGEGDFMQAGADRIARYLRQARLNKDVKVVVLRINSPGGSAYAAELITQEARLLAQEKPLVVSMGTYAASGGYWIATSGDYIFASESTITGSIGVFGLLFNVQELANDNGITFDGVKTGALADIFSPVRPKTDAEMTILQDLVDDIYQDFITKVAQNRNLPTQQVHSIAQGRIWTGSDAVRVGLADEIGGLDAALKKAQSLAGLKDSPRIVQYPEVKDFSELLAEFMQSGQGHPFASSMRPGTTEAYLQDAKQQLRMLQSFNDPTGIYARLPLYIQAP